MTGKNKKSSVRQVLECIEPIVRPLLNIVGGWLEKRRKAKAKKAKAKEQEEKASQEKWKQLRDWAAALDAALPNYDGYVEYAGEEQDFPFEGHYDFTNAKISAESLMWQRIKAKYGDAKVDVETMYVPYPWNSWTTLFRLEKNEKDKLKFWRLYYNVKTSK